MKAALIIIGFVLAVALLDSVLTAQREAATEIDPLAEHVPSARLPASAMTPASRNDKSLAHWQK